MKLSDADADYLPSGAVPDAIADILLATASGPSPWPWPKNGILLASPAERVRVPAARVAVVDTTGAGDTVMASLIADVVDDDVEAAGRRATAAAAITVSRTGAGLPHWSELAL